MGSPEVAKDSGAPNTWRTVYEDARFLVVDKPGGWLTIPSRQGDTDERKVLHAELQKIRAEKIFIVHRLDAEVSGLVLFAKTAEAHRVGSMWFEGHVIQKTYEAWTDGEIPAELGTASTAVIWECKLARGKKRAYEAPHGKDAKTGVASLGEIKWNGERLGRFHLQPFTGRSHQLRFEMFRHGMPVVGDELYGSKREFVAGAIALRAVRLDFSRCPDGERGDLPLSIETSGLTEHFALRE